jgi:uncharacterized protein (DUF2252 family)
MEMERSRFAGYRRIVARGRHITLTVRELPPQDLKIEIEHLSRNDAMEVAEFLAPVVGRGHARQMDATGGKQWVAELQRNRSKSLDAPSWLWNSVMELVAAHEAAYLQHCRR